ncbi:hypothetical protein DL93DRAFT_2051005 [Clavulina sp. PMI_390]|nr:hypothetical protein DL93DRAFT_2051005 [Clavulina sp. PMI_390]
MQFTKKASPIVDIPTLIEGIDIFLADIGRQTMALPPMDAASRKKVHEIAHAYSLKSKSVGKGGDRRTTLIRTSLSGLNVSQGKIRALLKRFGAYKHGTEFAQAWDRRAGKDEGKKMIRHRDGDVVGHKAARIDESNMGFKMLQRMGWKDGERIGVTPGGLAQPLMAVMKNSKLGLGAVKTSQFQ